MGRIYAGVLGPLAMAVVICRGWLASGGVESTLSQAFLYLIVFAVVGALIDVCENLTLFHLIKTSKRDAWAKVARSLEVLKLVSPAIATIYALTVGIWGIINVFTT